MTELKQKRILVVDDEESVLTAIEDFLHRLGYGVLTAISGKGALRQLEEEPDVDAVMLDISLPDINGIDLLAEIMKRPVYPPVIVMTGAGEARIFDAMRIGVSGFLLKPFTMETLRSSLEACFPA